MVEWFGNQVDVTDFVAIARNVLQQIKVEAICDSVLAPVAVGGRQGSA